MTDNKYSEVTLYIDSEKFAHRLSLTNLFPDYEACRDDKTGEVYVHDKKTNIIYKQE